MDIWSTFLFIPYVFSSWYDAWPSLRLCLLTLPRRVILLTVELHLRLSTSVTPHIMHTYASYMCIILHHSCASLSHHTYICITSFMSRLVDKHLDILGFIVSLYFFLSQLIIWSRSFFLAPNHLGVSSAAGRVSHGADSDISAAASPTSSIGSSPKGSSDWRYIF